MTALATLASLAALTALTTLAALAALVALVALAALTTRPEGDPKSVLAVGYLDGQTADVDGAQQVAAGTVVLVALVSLVRVPAAPEEGVDEGAKVLLAAAEEVGIEAQADC